MTRINLVPVEELSDQHLMAEYRELPMVPAALNRSLKSRSPQQILASIPEQFTLNTGHVTFFYDKLNYLEKRYAMLVNELLKRGFNLNMDRDNRLKGFPHVFYNDYTPDQQALDLVRERISLRIAEKPEWYRFRDS